MWIYNFSTPIIIIIFNFLFINAIIKGFNPIANGNTFQVKDVFQKVSPPHRLSPISRINEILEPFGVDWYFGKRHTIEQLINEWKKNNTENKRYNYQI